MPAELVKSMNEMCDDEFLSLLLTLSCYKTNGTLGSRCYFTVGNHIENVQPLFDNIWLFCFETSTPGSNICPEVCRDSLIELSLKLGCCSGTIYYGDTILDSLFIDGEISIEEGKMFEVISIEIFEVCDVPIIPFCSGDPFRQ